MIPQKLTIQGLYSYREAVTIDFGKLLEGRLFGIFGPVGSGKSTILEAITFALYGETERLNKQEARNYNMMNLRSHELLVDYEFRLGAEQYKFTVKGRRNKKQFEQVRLERAAYQKKGDEWEPLETLSAEPLLGLSYENFRRTVIIPQGKFQEFLQLTDKQRTEMMKELFGLQQYELYHPVQDLYRKNEMEKTALTSRLENLGEEITEDHLKKRRQDLEQLEKRISEREGQWKELQETLKALEKQKEQAGELEQKRKELAGKKEKEPEVRKLKETLRKKEKAEQTFRPLLDRLRALEQRDQELEQELEEARKEQQELLQDLEKAEKEWKVFEQEWQQKDQIAKEGQDREQGAKLIGLLREKQQQEKRLEDACPEIEKAEKALEKARKELEQGEKALMEQKKAVPDQKELRQVRDWLSREEDLSFRNQELQEALEALQKTGAQLPEEVAELLGPVADLLSLARGKCIRR